MCHVLVTQRLVSPSACFHIASSLGVVAKMLMRKALKEE